MGLSLLPDLCGRVVSGKRGPTLWESIGREGEGSILHLGGGASWGLCTAVARRAEGLRRVWISSRLCSNASRSGQVYFPFS